MASERFWSKVVKTDGCWQWRGAIRADGYGYFRFNGVARLAHRVALQLSGIELVDGLVVDHLCRNRACVNPAHLEQTTHAENVRRGAGGATSRQRALAMTQCKRGHEFTEKNTRVNPNGSRSCRACCALLERERRAGLR